jgi:hypothetical protein
MTVKGRGRSISALSTPAKRSTVQTVAATANAGPSGGRRADHDSTAASTIQTSPAYPIQVSPRKIGSSQSIRCSVTHR